MVTRGLDESLKEEIQTAYRRWLAAHDFRARRGQREMIAFVARSLAEQPEIESPPVTRDCPPKDRDSARGSPETASLTARPHVGVVEAGTGTGKTAAYCLAAIPVARRMERKLVIATATVALQEQVLQKDLPGFREHFGRRFEFALAKGRQRYLCVKRLDERLEGSDERQLPMFEQDDADATDFHRRLLDAFATSRWDGELDSWPEALNEPAWRAVTTDHRGCTGNRCSYFRQCPYFRARAQLAKADVIVANQDLLLADLALGGGVVLPPPPEAIYVIDEAHHLPDKTQQHFTLRVRAQSTAQWLDQVETLLGSLAQRMGRPPELEAAARAVAAATPHIRQRLDDLVGLVAQLPYDSRDAKRRIHRFPLGAVPPAIAVAAREAESALELAREQLASVHELLQSAVDGDLDWGADEAEDWLPTVGAQLGRAEGAVAAFRDFADERSADGTAPHARWITSIESRGEGTDDHELVSVPLDVGPHLESVLWSRCEGAVCTSATLTGLGHFDRFLDRVGLPRDTPAIRIPSPFRYGEIASFRVPAMRTDPRTPAAHTEEVAALLPRLLEGERSALVLFASWRQLEEVVQRVPPALRTRFKVQSAGSKQRLLDEHRGDIDRGEASYVIGVASFAEGVDLPDDYCRHVIIVKLPFSVPDEPLDQAAAEWVESQGRNPFFEISLPDASMRLVQACGRLIRHEGDHGRITLLDRRIVTQRYGRSLLEALPPFRRELEASP